MVHKPRAFFSFMNYCAVQWCDERERVKTMYTVSYIFEVTTLPASFYLHNDYIRSTLEENERRIILVIYLLAIVIQLRSVANPSRPCFSRSTYVALGSFHLGSAGGVHHCNALYCGTLRLSLRNIASNCINCSSFFF